MGKNRLTLSMICRSGRWWSTRSVVGLTLIEVIVSITVLAILAGIAIPLYIGYIDKARIDTAIGDITTISSALTSFYNDHEQYPQSLAEVGYDAYLDPWGNPYQYLNIQTAENPGQVRGDSSGTPLNTDYDLYSMGKDGIVSSDDIIRAKDGAYIGSAGDF